MLMMAVINVCGKLWLELAVDRSVAVQLRFGICDHLEMRYCQVLNRTVSGQFLVVVGKKKTPKVLRQGEGMEGRKKKERVRKKAAKIYFKEKGSETDTTHKRKELKNERKKGRQKHRERKRERENREMKEEIKKEQTKFESKGIKRGNDLF